MCIHRSRDKATPQQHDSQPTTDEHDAYNSNSPQPQSQQEEKGSSEVGQESSKVLKDTESGSKKSTAGAKDKAKKMAAAAAQKKKRTKCFIHGDPKECKITEDKRQSVGNTKGSRRMQIGRYLVK